MASKPITEKTDSANRAVLDNVPVDALDEPITGRMLINIMRDYTQRMHHLEKADYLPMSQLARALGMTYYGCTNFLASHTVACKKSAGGRKLYSLYDAKQLLRAEAMGIHA